MKRWKKNERGELATKFTIFTVRPNEFDISL